MAGLVGFEKIDSLPCWGASCQPNRSADQIAALTKPGLLR
jgi:hypothetical protein